MAKSVLLVAGLLAAVPASAATRDSAEDAFRRYQAKINLHDFSQLATDVVAPDALFVFGSETHQGLPAVRLAFEQTWSDLPDEVYLMSEPQWPSLDRDSAVVRFAYSYRGTTKEGKTLTGGGTGTNLYRRSAKRWRLAYEHLAPDPKVALASGPTRIQRKVLLETPLAQAKPVTLLRSDLITLPPGSIPGAHRHPVPVVGYVVEGEILLKEQGQPGRIVKAGEAFHEPANVIIEHFDNHSADRPAVFVAQYLLGPDDSETVEMLPPQFSSSHDLSQ